MARVSVCSACLKRTQLPGPIGAGCLTSCPAAVFCCIFVSSHPCVFATQ